MDSYQHKVKSMSWDETQCDFKLALNKENNLLESLSHSVLKKILYAYNVNRLFLLAIAC